MMGKDGFKAAKVSFKDVEGFIYLNGDELTQLQDVLYEMLQDFLRVLDKYHIFYTLSGGSVLGAIRHQGFIPWDDDIDINMPRKSFEQLKKVFQKELGKEYILHAPEFSESYGFSVAHFGKKDTVYRIFNNVDLPEKDCCIGFDIFILENTFNNAILRKIHGCICLAAGYLLNCRKVYDFYSVLMNKYRLNKASRDCFIRKYRIGSMIHFISLNQLSRFVYHCYSLNKNDNSLYVAIPSGRKHYFGEMYLRKDMCRAGRVKFRELTVNIPAGTDAYMRRLYGDTYMVPPSESEREQHPVIKIDFGR